MVAIQTPAVNPQHAEVIDAQRFIELCAYTSPSGKYRWHADIVRQADGTFSVDLMFTHKHKCWCTAAMWGFRRWNDARKIALAVARDQHERIVRTRKAPKSVAREARQPKPPRSFPNMKSRRWQREREALDIEFMEDGEFDISSRFLDDDEEEEGHAVVLTTYYMTEPPAERDLGALPQTYESGGKEYSFYPASRDGECPKCGELPERCRCCAKCKAELAYLNPYVSKNANLFAWDMVGDWDCTCHRDPARVKEATHAERAARDDTRRCDECGRVSPFATEVKFNDEPTCTCRPDYHTERDWSVETEGYAEYAASH